MKKIETFFPCHFLALSFGVKEMSGEEKDCQLFVDKKEVNPWESSHHQAHGEAWIWYAQLHYLLDI